MPSRALRTYRTNRKHKSISAPRPTRRLGLFSGTFLVLFLLVGLLLGGGALASVTYFTGDLPDIAQLASVRVPLSTYIYDRTGNHLLYTLEDERRELFTLDAVPPLLQQATIAIEDKSFWTNVGIDPSGIMRAALSNYNRGATVQGGSTITQQLVKTRLTGDEVTITRKIREAFLALEAARAYSKQQILEMYFNQIFYGNQAYGLRAASKTYFGKPDMAHLTLGEIALLAGLPQAPSEYDPVQNPEAAASRRALVLDAMLEQGYITLDQANTAKAEPIKVQPASTSLAAPHFTFRVREQLINVLGEKAAYRGGYKVLTSLDWDLQQLAERKVREHVDALKASNVNNAALITMDPSTGEVLAYVGSYDYYDRSPKVQGDYDVAGIALRQPGSTFKMFTYLTGMLKEGMTAATVVPDIAFEMNDGSGTTYKPQDATREQHGPVTIRQALRESLNLPALTVTRKVGVSAIIDTVHQLGINREWDPAKLGIAFGIGASEMRLIDMASAYQVLANKGVRVDPTMIMKIIDPAGKVIKDYTRPEGRRVLDERHAWIMTDILKDTTDPSGSFVFGPITSIGRPAALKTGTSDNIQDVLAIGYTPYRLTAVWMGNSDNSEMYGISSALGPGTLWREYMKAAFGYLPPDSFARPAGIVDKVVCVNPSLLGGNGSGKLPGPNCPFKKTEVFVVGTEPTSDDRDVYQPCGYRLVAWFPDWQKWADRWATGAVSGRYSYGRFNWRICGFSPAPSSTPSPSTSASPGPLPGTSQPPVIPPPTPPALPPTPAPVITPTPTKRP